MAQVTQPSQLAESIEHYLPYLLRQWSAIAQLAEEWDEWDEESQVTFIWNWGVVEDRLGEMEQWAEQGLLTPAQTQRFDEVQQVVACQRPTLRRLFAE